MIEAAESLQTSIKWTPESKGEYKIETFLWNNLETPFLLAPSQNIEIEIIW